MAIEWYNYGYLHRANDKAIELARAKLQAVRRPAYELKKIEKTVDFSELENVTTIFPKSILKKLYALIYAQEYSYYRIDKSSQKRSSPSSEVAQGPETTSKADSEVEGAEAGESALGVEKKETLSKEDKENIENIEKIKLLLKKQAILIKQADEEKDESEPPVFKPDFSQNEFERTALSTIYFTLQILEKMAETFNQKKVSSFNLTAYFQAAFLLALKTGEYDIKEYSSILNRIFSEYMKTDLHELHSAERELAYSITIPCYPTQEIREITDLLKSANDYPKVIDTLRKGIIKKSTAPTLAIFNSYIASYAEHLNQQPEDEILSQKKKAISSLKTVKEKQSSEDQLKALNSMLTPEFYKIITADRTIGFKLTALAFITIIPAIVLAIQSKYFSKKNTFQFWKSHGQLVYEKLESHNHVFRRCVIEERNTNPQSLLQ